MNSDLVTGAARVDVCRHLIRKQVKASPGELDARKGEHPGEFARHVHLLGKVLFNTFTHLTLDSGSLCWEKLLSVTGEKTSM